MKSNEILIIGAGDHAKIVADILENKNIKIIGFIDILNKKNNVGKKILNFPIIDILLGIEKYTGKKCFIATGNIVQRYNILSTISKLDMELVNAIHPSSIISKSVKMGKGNSISAGAIINVGVEIGDCNIINTGSTIDHNVSIGSFININPGVNIAGGVTIGDYSIIGIGAAIKDDIQIGRNVTIGAGAVVIEDIPKNSVAIGIPAKVVKYKEDI